MNIWELVSERLREIIGEECYERWFSNSKVIRENGNEIIIELENKDALEWVTSNYYDLIREFANEYTERQIKVNFTARNGKGQLISPQKGTTKQKKLSSKFVNLYYTFENFVVADFNRLAHAAAYSVARNPGQRMYNPLFIYGGNGLGKTHLLNAIANYIRKNLKELKVIYATAEKFKTDYTLSLKKGTLSEFHEGYRGVDVLLLDDVQLLKGWESTQEELFHLFNSLYMRGKQIVFTGDCSPKLLEGIQQRLLSRFNSGLVIEIREPNVDAKVAILRKKAEEQGIILVHDIMEYIAINSGSDIRELENCLKTLYVHVCIYNKPITIDTAREVLRFYEKQKKKKLTPEIVLEYVAEEFKIKKDEILSRKRTKEISFARYIAMFITRELFDISLKSIGKYTGGRNHATVIHGCEMIKNLMFSDQAFKKRLESLIMRIRSECE